MTVRLLMIMVMLAGLGRAGVMASLQPAEKEEPQPAAPTSPEPDVPEAAEPRAPQPTGIAALPTDIVARLETLHPGDPEGYFLLGEEVAEFVDDTERLELARSLFGLAFELDRRRGGAGSLAASAALGLAQVERLERDRRWLIALAGAMDERYLLPDWSVAAWPSVTEDLAFKAASVIGLSRAGEGREARRLLDEPGVRDVLQRYERALGVTGAMGALSRVERYAEQWPCRECANSRSVSRPTPRGPEARLCPTCEGRLGPRLSDEEFVAQLRFESALLSGIHRSWGAQVIADAGAPLRDPDAEELAATYRVDPARPYWRKGQWVARP